MKMLFLGAALVIVALSGGCSLLKIKFGPVAEFPESRCSGYSFDRIDEFNECIKSAMRLKVLSGSHTSSIYACQSIQEAYQLRLSSGSTVSSVYSLNDCIKDPVVEQNIQRRVAAWRYQQQREDQVAEERAKQQEAEAKKEAEEAEAKKEAERKAEEEYTAQQQAAFELVPPEESQLMAQRIGSLYRLKAFSMLKTLEDRCWQEKSVDQRKKAAFCSMIALSGAIAYQSIGVGIPPLIYEPAAVEKRNLGHIKKLLNMNTNQAADFFKKFVEPHKGILLLGLFM
jgi:flagellar biosynthesis GTPase FlhF